MVYVEAMREMETAANGQEQVTSRFIADPSSADT